MGDDRPAQEFFIAFELHDCRRIDMVNKSVEHAKYIGRKSYGLVDMFNLLSHPSTKTTIIVACAHWESLKPPLSLNKTCSKSRWVSKFLVLLK